MRPLPLRVFAVIALVVATIAVASTSDDGTSQQTEGNHANDAGERVYLGPIPFTWHVPSSSRTTIQVEPLADRDPGAARIVFGDGGEPAVTILFRSAAGTTYPVAALYWFPTVAWRDLLEEDGSHRYGQKIHDVGGFTLSVSPVRETPQDLTTDDLDAFTTLIQRLTDPAAFSLGAA